MPKFLENYWHLLPIIVLIIIQNCQKVKKSHFSLHIYLYLKHVQVAVERMCFFCYQAHLHCTLVQKEYGLRSSKTISEAFQMCCTQIFGVQSSIEDEVL